jgi:serine/threonine protein kinase
MVRSLACCTENKTVFPPAVPNCRIGRLLGEGTTGTVYEAVNASGEALAIKFLRETFADDPEMVARFKREASICQRLRSEHIAAVVGAGRTQETYWIAYRRLVGETLDKRVRRERVMPLAALAPIVEQVLRGLAVAHAAGVVHRDIKPANIMLERTGAGERACILDFGISKDRSRSGTGTLGRSLTSHTATLGTINYMPPEQIGASAAVDHRADLYSVGVVAYRAMTGQLPYVGSSQAAVMHAKINLDARSLADATGTRWPDALERFFRRALAREPSARFEDAGSMDAAWADAWADACGRATTPDIERLRRRNADTEDGDDTVLDDAGTSQD